MNKKEVSGFIKFIKEYNSTGYGQAEVIETKQYIIITCYNAGWSENEELEQQFLEGLGQYYLFYDNHPLKYFRIFKLLLEHTDPTIFDEFRKLTCYEKKIKFEHNIVIE